MPLAVSRLREFPVYLKLATLLTTVLLMISLSLVSDSPPGTAIIWFTVGVSMVIDVSMLVLILSEHDTQVFPLGIVTYLSAETASSLLLVIFYVISTGLCINSEEMTQSFAFTLSSLLCAVNAGLFSACTVSYLRKWLAEHRAAAARQESDNLDYPNYGADE